MKIISIQRTNVLRKSTILVVPASGETTAELTDGDFVGGDVFTDGNDGSGKVASTDGSGIRQVDDVFPVCWVEGCGDDFDTVVRPSPLGC